MSVVESTFQTLRNDLVIPVRQDAEVFRFLGLQNERRFYRFNMRFGDIWLKSSNQPTGSTFVRFTLSTLSNAFLFSINQTYLISNPREDGWHLQSPSIIFSSSIISKPMGETAIKATVHFDPTWPSPPAEVTLRAQDIINSNNAWTVGLEDLGLDAGPAQNNP